MATQSAGLLLHRSTPATEVLLGHMGGPFWVRRDRAWTIPKGRPEPGEDLHATALREFAEELGSPPPPGRDVALGSVRQRGGTVVTAWARAGDLDVTTIVSTPVEMEWPPRSGRTVVFAELDRAAWWPLDRARELVVAAQVDLLDRLAALLTAPGQGAGEPGASGGP